MLEAVLLKLHAKLAAGWALIRVNFDPMQENGPKVGGSFGVGPFSQGYGTQFLHVQSYFLQFSHIVLAISLTKVYQSVSTVEH